MLFLFFCQGLWLRLLRLGATEDPLSSFEYGTILGMLESDTANNNIEANCIKVTRVLVLVSFSVFELTCIS